MDARCGGTVVRALARPRRWGLARPCESAREVGLCAPFGARLGGDRGVPRGATPCPTSPASRGCDPVRSDRAEALDGGERKARSSDVGERSGGWQGTCWGVSSSRPVGYGGPARPGSVAIRRPDRAAAAPGIHADSWPPDPICRGPAPGAGTDVSGLPLDGPGARDGRGECGRAMVHGCGFPAHGCPVAVQGRLIAVHGCGVAVHRRASQPHRLVSLELRGAGTPCPRGWRAADAVLTGCASPRRLQAAQGRIRNRRPATRPTRGGARSTIGSGVRARRSPRAPRGRERCTTQWGQYP